MIAPIRFVLILLPVIVCGLRGSFAMADEPLQRLNVLLITADDLNADSAGWLGNPLNPTPNLDAFAKTSHRFVNAHVTIPICQPGRAVLMTGRLPHHNGALGFGPINDDVVTLPEILRGHGYFTGAIAKTPHMKPDAKFPWDAVGEQALGKQPAEFATKFRQMLSSAKTQQKPFFINANICDPHRPFIKVNSIPDTSNSPAERAPTLEGVRIFQSEEVSVTAFLEDLPEIRREIAQYYTNVSRFDVTFGLIMQVLTDAGHDDDTIVVFLSDHGMSFPFAKATVYYNGTWSPTLLRIPGEATTQTRSEWVSSLDVMPTLLELLKIDGPATMDGRSWVPLLEGKFQADRDFVITQVNTVFGGRSLAQRCLRTANRSLLFHAWAEGPNKFQVEAMSGLSFAAMQAATNPQVQARVQQFVSGETLMLFDTQLDPTERINRVHDPDYAEDFLVLSQKLLSRLRASDDPQAEAFLQAITKHSKD
jgi:N-sulfoglucosamine sulfohydrolase